MIPLCETFDGRDLFAIHFVDTFYFFLKMGGEGGRAYNSSSSNGSLFLDFVSLPHPGYIFENHYNASELINDSSSWKRVAVGTVAIVFLHVDFSPTNYEQQCARREITSG